jgi:uncharacterized protein (DUF4415 family)
MKKERIVTRRFDDLRKGKTDWARVKALTDEEITRAMASDPDWADDMDIDWSNAVIVTPAKKAAISIRVDEDVLDFFKAGGAGYQSRMNAVLRHFVSEQKKQKKKERA